MNVSSISLSNLLGADVLQMIFQKLDGKDLRNCEAVCRQWRDILLAGTPWRRLFHRKILYSHLWRNEQKKLESNQQTLRTDQYRSVCKNLFQVERNWRMGRLHKSVYSVNAVGCYMTRSDDFVAWNLYEQGDECGRDGAFQRMEFSFLDTESMKITVFSLICGGMIMEEMLVHWGCTSEVEVCDHKNKWIVDVWNDEEFDRRQISFASGRLFQYSSDKNSGLERIRVWKMGHPSTLIHDCTFKNRNLFILKVDEQFIVATENGQKVDKPVHFISTESLEVFTSLNLNGFKWEYDRGLLFEFRGNGIVRILDVASKTYFNDVRIPFRKEEERFVDLLLRSWASSNSNVMVIGWKYSKESSGILSHLSVYDLEAVKKRNSDPDFHLLYTLQFEFDMEKFVMNEKLIAFSGYHTPKNSSVMVLNFANNFAERKSSDTKENLEVNEDVKMRIIYDPCVSYPY
jgi:F-box-like